MADENNVENPGAGDEIPAIPVPDNEVQGTPVPADETPDESVQGTPVPEDVVFGTPAPDEESYGTPAEPRAPQVRRADGLARIQPLAAVDGNRLPVYLLPVLRSAAVYTGGGRGWAGGHL